MNTLLILINGCVAYANGKPRTILVVVLGLQIGDHFVLQVAWFSFFQSHGFVSWTQARGVGG